MKKIIYLIGIILNLTFLYAQKFELNFNDEDLLKVVIRSNYKVYISDKYFGLYTRELKGIFKVSLRQDNKYLIKGKIYNLEKTIKNSLALPDRLNSIEDYYFVISNNGEIIEKSDKLFFPVDYIPYFQDENININDVYERKVNLNIPMYYEKELKAFPASLVVKYKGLSDLNGDKYDLFENYIYLNIKNDEFNEMGIKSNHNLKLYFDSPSGIPVYIDERFEDRIEYLNEKNVTYKGFNLYFYNKVKRLDKKKILSDIVIDDKNGFVKETDNGVSIILNNLHFQPDSVEIVESDESVLDDVFDSLNKINDRTFLITGHTASTGDPEKEHKLSEERALSISRYLIERGIERKRLLFTGKGSTEPVAPNDTEENKSKNRRVEITILED